MINNFKMFYNGKYAMMVCSGVARRGKVYLDLCAAQLHTDP